MTTPVECYARVIDGAIVEYPVLPLYIKNRAHPVEWYTPCVYTPKPVVDEFHYTREVTSLAADGQSVIVSYIVVANTVHDLLRRLPVPEGTEAKFHGEIIPQNPPATPELLAKIKELILEKVDGMLDEFAQTRGYSTILSATTYATSSVAKFAKEAADAIKIRDTTWSALYAYMAEIEAGKAPMPLTFKEVQDKLPPMVWTA